PDKPQAVEMRLPHVGLRSSSQHTGIQRPAGHVEHVDILHEDTIGTVVEHKSALQIGRRAVAYDANTVDPHVRSIGESVADRSLTPTAAAAAAAVAIATLSSVAASPFAP